MLKPTISSSSMLRPSTFVQATRNLAAGSNVVSIDRSKSAGSRRRDRARRRAAVSRLRQVGRVHAPEADMRPVLPHRELLLKSVAEPIPRPSLRTEKSSEKTDLFHNDNNVISDLSARAKTCAQFGDIDGLSDVIRDAQNVLYPANQAICQRVVAISAVQSIAAGDANAIDDCMNCLVQSGLLQSLPNEDVGMLLDILVRGMIRRGDISSAFRGELLSRVLETRLRRGTYTSLIAHSEHLEIGLSIFHRAIAVGAEPNQKMFNVLLEVCFEASDGKRARATLAEMASRGLHVNSETISVLLRRSSTLDSIQAMVQLLKAPNAGLRLSPNMAALFIKAFIAAGGQDGADDRYIEMCFATIDWFFERGIGVSRHTLEQLVMHCAHTGRGEAALRAWREMRRGWMGAPSRRARRALWVALNSTEIGRDVSCIRRLLEEHIGEAEREGLHRALLAYTEDVERDDEVLAQGSVKDKATILHRWIRDGRAQDAMDWIGAEVDREGGRGLDASLILAVLADTSKTRSVCLRFCLDHLSSGSSVHGRKEEVVERTVDMVWRWIVAGGKGEGVDGMESRDEQVEMFGDKMDMAELRTCIHRVVRVARRF